MTKKDFIRFADALAQIDNDMVRMEQTNSQIAILEQTNPKFDAVRFRTYIELKRKKVKKERGQMDDRAKRIKEKYKWVGIK
jgi:hypothetical protein